MNYKTGIPKSVKGFITITSLKNRKRNIHVEKIESYDELQNGNTEIKMSSGVSYIAQESCVEISRRIQETKT